MPADRSSCTDIRILLLLLRAVSFRRQLVCIDSPSLQTNVIQSVLIGNIDILLLRNELYLNVTANTLDGPQIHSLDTVGALGTPG